MHGPRQGGQRPSREAGAVPWATALWEVPFLSSSDSPRVCVSADIHVVCSCHGFQTRGDSDRGERDNVPSTAQGSFHSSFHFIFTTIHELSPLCPLYRCEG